MNKNAVGYIRVSSEDQIKNYSLDNQADYCKAYCLREGYNLIKIFRDEGKSAKSLDRPELINLLEYCRKNKDKVDACVIYKIDRLSRNTLDYLVIKSRLSTCGVSIVSITEPMENNAAGAFVETLMAAVGAFDNATKSERTKDGMTKRLESGLPTNPLSVGYKYQKGADDKNFPVRDDPRFTQLQQAGYDYLTGIYTKIQISELLNKRGFTTMTGKPASSQFISKFFSNVFYKGVIYSRIRDKCYPGKHEKMFTEEEWYQIQQISNGSAFTAQPKKRNNPDFPLRHFTLCGQCQAPMTGNWSKGRSRKYAYYRCLNHGPSVTVESFESEFYGLLLSIRPKEYTLERFTRILKEKYDAKYKELSSDITTLKKELDELYELRKTLVKKNMDGVYDDDLFREQDEVIKSKIVVKKVQISEGSMQKLDIDIICTFAKHFLQNLAQTWKNADLETKQRLQEIIFPEGVVYCFPGYRITVLSCLFKVLRDSDESDERLGWPTGIEPVTSASTGQRSTAELRPP